MIDIYREHAVQRVLAILRNPLALMSIASRHEAEEMCTFYNLTALELLQCGRKQAQNA